MVLIITLLSDIFANRNSNKYFILEEKYSGVFDNIMYIDGIYLNKYTYLHVCRCVKLYAEQKQVW